MPRLPLLPAEPEDDVTAAVFDVFRQERREPIALYRVLAHAPKMLRAYSTLARGLRYDASTPRALRELVILRSAQLTHAGYEWSHHVPMARAAGVPDEQIEALAEWESSDRFDDRERAALRLVDRVHALAVLDDDTDDVRRVFSEAETVELVLLAAFYETVARVVQALDLEIEPAYEQYRGVLGGP